MRLSSTRGSHEISALSSVKSEPSVEAFSLEKALKPSMPRGVGRCSGRARGTASRCEAHSCIKPFLQLVAFLEVRTFEIQCLFI